MSNFTGVTFAEQKVLPSDDAIIRRNILSDGILHGCELSYSGSTLTMAEGQLLACGRQFRHPSSQNWAVVDATSGFARLLLTVDLTRTSTKEVFEQIVDSIEYASSEDGFPELEQTNINVSGSRYQLVACVVSLGTGGITGIVSQLGPCEATGGGGLNFSVVGGLTQPADPKENTIWVNTDQKITSWMFSATEPTEPEEGMIWIRIGTSSPIAFNALKKNGIQTYPLDAKQSVNGAWVTKTAKSYQGGAWKQWITYLYHYGDECVDITGGWNARGWACESNSNTYTAKKPTFTKNEDNMYLSLTGTNVSGVAEIEKDIDFTGYNTIHVDCVFTRNADYNHSRLVITNRNNTNVSDNTALYVQLNGEIGVRHTVTADISSINSKLDLALLLQAHTSNATVTLTVYDIWLE